MKIICKTITPETLKTRIALDGGVTIKNGKMIAYTSGWQVADYGFVVPTIEECYQLVKQFRFTDCGIWYSAEQGGYCIDHSVRVATKKAACTIGADHNQESVLKWHTMEYFNMKGEKIVY